MKPTQKNIDCLYAMGFVPQDKSMDNWWNLKDGWGFRMDSIKSIKYLVYRLRVTAYESGFDDRDDHLSCKSSRYILFK